MLPWFENQFPLFLAPMAGVTDKTFRQLCKEQGADVVTTEFVSAEGIFRRNSRTLEYLDFDDVERPLGIQLFGAEPDHLGEAARMVIDWKRPDFIDLNFGCPVNKVVTRNGGSALLKDSALLRSVAGGVVRAVAPFPVTAKIRLGWDSKNRNAVSIARLLEECGIRALAVHGRTKEQGYSGEADWEMIARVVEGVSIPVIGNGDITCAADVLRRREQTRVAGVMIGRAAMSAPWIFAQVKHCFTTGLVLPEPSLADQWAFIGRHCRLAVERRGVEVQTMHSMRARLMAYSRGMDGAKNLRSSFQHISTLAELENIAHEHLCAHRAT